jgi:hypothetical protein
MKEKTMQINITKITATKYSFKANNFEFFAEANANTGQWLIPSFRASDFNLLSQNSAQLAYNQVAQLLRKNPLFINSKKIDGKTGKTIFTRNPAFN